MAPGIAASSDLKALSWQVQDASRELLGLLLWRTLEEGLAPDTLGSLLRRTLVAMMYPGGFSDLLHSLAFAFAAVFAVAAASSR